MNTQTNTLHAPYARGERVHSTAGVVERARATFALWRTRSRQRRALAELSPELLKDIGVSPGQAMVESRKPFWRA